MKYDVKRRIFKILKNFKDKELIKVATGIRRCGKSTLFDLFEGYLLDDGVDESQIIKINLEEPIYHLGDFCLSSDDDIKNIFNRLNGNKILIRGNHDRKSVKFYKDIGFEVLTHAPIVLEEYKLILSHVPLPDVKIKNGYINLHGHIHNKNISEDYPKNIYSEIKHINLSIDVTDYKPLSLDKINEIRSKNYEIKR